MFISNRLLGGLALMFAACAGESRQAEVAPQSIPPAEEPSGAATPGVAAATSADATSQGTSTTSSSDTPSSGAPAADTPSVSKPEGLNDAEIALVVELANKGEVEQGKIAQKRAKNARVKKFATMMVTDHGKAQKEHEKLVSQAGLTPDESTLSTQLAADSEKSLTALNQADAANFDRTYIDTQVDVHSKVLDAIDTQLIPNAKNEQLKAELTKVRGVVEAHLKEARDIQQTLTTSGGATSNTPASKAPASTTPASKPTTAPATNTPAGKAPGSNAPAPEKHSH
jgi:putative membrane protein